jgi:peptidyl-prolyl cis-trans isomerase SurA
MNIRIRTVKTAAAALILVSFFSSSPAMQKIDGVAAFVGDSIILMSELDAYILMKSGGVPDSTGDSLSRSIVRNVALDELIDGKVLLVKAAKDTNIIITENEIDAELNSRVQTIISQNNLSIAEFETILKNQQGISLARFKDEVRKQIRQELLKQKVQQQYVPMGGPGRSEVEQFFAEYKDSLPPAGKSVRLSVIQIKVSVPDSIRRAAYAKIKAIKDRLDNGEDFSEVAKLFSDGADAAIGGDLGFISKGTLNELAFEEKAFSVPAGQISDIFETRLGFHVIHVVEKKDSKVHVKQIFVPVAPPQERIQASMALLDSVRISCKSTKDFADAAVKFSTDKITRSKSGSLGWQELSALDSPTLTAVDSLAPGALSAVINTDNTLCLYRVDERADSRPVSIEEDWAEISSLAQRINSQKKLLELVRKWRQETYIDIRL